VKKGVSTLLFAGVNTDQCVLGTLVDAYNCGWGCVLVDDCCGTTTKGGKEVSLWNVAVSNSLNIRYGSVLFVLALHHSLLLWFEGLFLDSAPVTHLFSIARPINFPCSPIKSQ